MPEIANLLTPALVIALFAWLRSDIRKLHDRLDSTAKGLNDRDSTGGLNDRLDAVARDFNDRLDVVAKDFDDRLDAVAKDFNDRLDSTAKGFNERLDASIRDIHDRLDKRFDAVLREIGDLRERMAKMEGSLEGFLAGRRDRDAA